MTRRGHTEKGTRAELWSAPSPVLPRPPWMRGSRQHGGWGEWSLHQGHPGKTSHLALRISGAWLWDGQRTRGGLASVPGGWECWWPIWDPAVCKAPKLYVIYWLTLGCVSEGWDILEMYPGEEGLRGAIFLAVPQPSWPDTYRSLFWHTLWGSAKAVLRGKYTATQACLRNEGQSHINSLNSQWN